MPRCESSRKGFHWGFGTRQTRAFAPGPVVLAGKRVGRTAPDYDRDMTEIKLKKGEPVEKAIRRLKKKLDREQTLQQFRLRRRFEKPSAKRRRKEKAARFAAMLRARYADE